MNKPESPAQISDERCKHCGDVEENHYDRVQCPTGPDSYSATDYFEPRSRLEPVDPIPSPVEAACKHEYEAVDAGPLSDDIFYSVCKKCGLGEPVEAVSSEPYVCNDGDHLVFVRPNGTIVAHRGADGCVCPASGTNRFHEPKQSTPLLGQDEPAKLPADKPWDMPTSDRKTYDLVASVCPEERSPVMQLFKRYADFTFELVQIRDSLAAQQTQVLTSLAAAQKEIEELKRLLSIQRPLHGVKAPVPSSADTTLVVQAPDINKELE